MKARNNAWFEKAMPRMAQVCLVVLPFVYGFGFWRWHSALEADFARQAPVVVKAVDKARPDQKKLAALFGNPQTTPAAVAAVKESTLSLKLVASYMAGEQGRSAAVIASGGHSQKLYFQGEKIAPGVELVSVQARRILIKRNGVLESVSLEENGTAELPPAVATGAADRKSTPAQKAQPGRQELTEKLNRLKSLASGEL